MRLERSCPNRPHRSKDAQAEARLRPASPRSRGSAGQDLLPAIIATRRADAVGLDRRAAVAAAHELDLDQRVVNTPLAPAGSALTSLRMCHDESESWRSPSEVGPCRKSKAQRIAGLGPKTMQRLKPGSAAPSAGAIAPPPRWHRSESLASATLRSEPGPAARQHARSRALKHRRCRASRSPWRPHRPPWRPVFPCPAPARADRRRRRRALRRPASPRRRP